MTTGFFQFFNSKAQRAQKRANAEQKSRSRRDRSPLKPRRLLTEALEERKIAFRVHQNRRTGFPFRQALTSVRLVYKGNHRQEETRIYRFRLHR